jgi:hypothetical protein
MDDDTRRLDNCSHNQHQQTKENNAVAKTHQFAMADGFGNAYHGCAA